jgi:hypothetical protein
MGAPAYELIFSLIAAAGITAGYVFLAQGGAPQPSGAVGHTLGIVGFVLMLCTETLYSLRKRLPGFHFGRMSLWLQFHVFTGIVGPYLVLLHAGWRFHGLAGVLTLLTVVVVVSGLVGRYLYTAVPRSLDGVVVAVAELERRIATTDLQLQALGIDVRGRELAAATTVPQSGWRLVLGRPFLRWGLKRRLRRAVERLNPAGQARAAPLLQLLTERQRLQMQLQSLDVTRRLLALWHMFHVPLTGVVFTLAFIHILAALYYATFLR